MLDFGAPLKLCFSFKQDPRLMSKLLRGLVLCLGMVVALSMVAIGFISLIAAFFAVALADLPDAVWLTAPVLVALAGLGVIGSLLGGFVLAGYGLRTLRAVQNETPPLLPEWDRYGEDLKNGFGLFVIGLVWSLPATVLSGLFQWLEIPVAGGILQFVVSIAVALATPGFIIAFAQRQRIADGLRMGAILSWTLAHLGQVAGIVIVGAFMGLAIFVVGTLVGAVAIGIGLLVTVPLSMFLVSLYSPCLYGQLARHADLTALDSP